MGIVQRQGIKYSIVNYIGLAIGVLSIIYVYPKAQAEYGLVCFLRDTCQILYPFISLGVYTIIIRFFPVFENKEQRNNGYLALILSWSFIGFLSCSILIAVFWDYIYAYYASKDALQAKFLIFIVPLLLLFTLGNVLYQYSICFKRIVIPSLINDFLIRIVIPILIIGFLYGFFDSSNIAWGLIIHGILILLLFYWYLKYIGEFSLVPNWDFISRPLRKDMIKFASLGIVGGVGFQLVNNLGGWMVATLLGSVSIGRYSIVSFLTNFLDVPTRGIVSVTAPMVAKYLHEDNFVELNSLYKKASINLLIPGLLLFGSFWISIDDLFRIMPNGDQIAQGKFIALYLGLAKMVDMATGLNNHIIYYSKHYSLVLLSLMVLALANIGFNLVLIPSFGITGAAIATFISNCLYNSFSYILLWRKFNLQPFNRNTLILSIIAIIVYLVVNFIPKQGNPYLSIIIHSGIFFTLFLYLVLTFKISKDLNDFILKLKSNFRSTLGF